MKYKYLCDGPYGNFPIKRGLPHTGQKGLFFLLNGKRKTLPCFFCNKLTSHKESYFLFLNNPLFDGKAEFRNLVLCCEQCQETEIKRYNEIQAFYDFEF